MEVQKLAIKEQIMKTVVKSGNGGAVWVPRAWLGEEVIVILPEKPKFKVEERVIHLLEPYLKDIISVGIYGSYARNEQTKESDVDVLVITKGKDIKLNLKKEKIDLVSYTIDKLKAAIESQPAVYYQMIQEAKPLINAYVLEELKAIQVTKESFKDYLTETKEHLESNKGLLELDKIDNIYLKSYSVLYSSMLRLRVLFIIKCILKKAKFSNKKFKKWLIGKKLSPQEFNDSYKVYKFIRDSQDTKGLRVKINAVEKILNILEEELKRLEAQIHGK